MVGPLPHLDGHRRTHPFYGQIALHQGLEIVYILAVLLHVFDVGFDAPAHIACDDVKNLVFLENIVSFAADIEDGLAVRKTRRVGSL